MSTLQIAHDTTNTLVVEWDKYAPHFRIVIDGVRSRAYATEEAALRAAKRLCRKRGSTLLMEHYSYD